MLPDGDGLDLMRDMLTLRPETRGDRHHRQRLDQQGRRRRCGPGPTNSWSNPLTRQRLLAPSAMPNGFGAAPRRAPPPNRRLQRHCRANSSARPRRCSRVYAQGPVGGALDGDSLHHRRKRHRQRGLRAGGARPVQPRQRAIRAAELRCDPARTAGIRGVRPSERVASPVPCPTSRARPRRRTAARCFSTRSARWT